MAPNTDEWGVTETLILDSEQNRKYHKQALDLLKKALELYGDGTWGGEWKMCAEDKQTGDTIRVLKTKEYGNVFAIQSTIDSDPDTLFRINWQDARQMEKWNPNVKEFQVVAELGSQSQLVHNCSEPLLGGLVSSRDFMDVRIWRKIGDAYCLAARSVQYQAIPPEKGRVRGDNRLGLFRVSPVQSSGHSTVVWMASLDLKGIIPKGVVERAMSTFLMDYIRHLRQHVERVGSSTE